MKNHQALALLLAAGLGSGLPSTVAQTAAPPPATSAMDYQVYRGTQVPPEVERLYEKGLKYLVSAQNADGGFPGQYGNEPGVVGFVVMAMLAHGDDPNHGPYNKAIKRSIDYILKAQGENGYIGSSMYNHGFATLALAEAYGALQDDRVGPALKKAVELIITSQDKT